MAWQPVLMASHQKMSGVLYSSSIVLAMSMSVWFLTLYYTILLRGVWSWKLFNKGVLEFGPIVASHFLDWETKLLLCSSNKYLHLLLNLALGRRPVQRDPYVLAPMVAWWSWCSLVGEVRQLAFRLDKRNKLYLPQSEHLLVQWCVHLLEVWPGSSSQHGLVSDAKVNPC